MHPVRLRGAYTHNLQGIDLDLHAGELVALTGPSGSGKSSLALDTLYAEGQRRFVESFSPYARQFLERLERPPIDSLEPVAATAAVDRKAPIKSSRSTLATMTDLEPYFAALFARTALPVCPTCHVEATFASARATAERLTKTHGAARALVSYPVRADDADAFLTLRDSLMTEGYRRLLVAGNLIDLDQVRPSDATAKGTLLEVVLDRLTLDATSTERLQQALEAGWARAEGRASLRIEERPELFVGDAGTTHVKVARGLSCPSCAKTFEPARAAFFSYNSALGACDACRGFGRTIAVDWDKVIPDPRLSLAKGAIKAWNGSSADWERRSLREFCKRRQIPLDAPWCALTEAEREAILEGEGGFEGPKFARGEPAGVGGPDPALPSGGNRFPGVRAWFRWLETRTYKMHVRVFLARYREYAVCAKCHGARLNEAALTYRVAGLDLGAWHKLTVSEARATLAALVVGDAQGERARGELTARLTYLDDVGLGYLTLDRQARTLSGGEAQRAALTSALGASLTGAAFVLDEPTVGLHACDVPALGRAIRGLADAGNIVVTIEHDEEIVRGSDRVVELGPAAGVGGGRLLFDGPPGELAGRVDLPTGRAWALARSRGAVARAKRTPRGALTVKGARAFNLQGFDVTLPLGVVCAITGASGSGKSTLAEDIVYRAVARATGDTSVPRPAAHDTITGWETLRRAALVDQAPLGRTARGNPATYTKAWDRLRARFAAEPEAKARGLDAAHFSFNVSGRTKGGAALGGVGRCEACSGEGYETVEMQFLADVALLCPACQGKRFKPEVLAVKHCGASVAEALALTIEEALARFSPAEAPDYVLRRALEPVVDVGLGYLPLGQPLSMISGGEAQRLKLARALSEPAKDTLFVIDEPSAGLHADDAAHVVRALHALADAGGSVILVEHDLDVIREADWVIDLGPGGGPHGGHVVAEGTPSSLLECPTSKTGEALQKAALPAPPLRATPRPKALLPDAITISHAREHNLKDVSVSIPHGQFTVVTGPSGSGKSSLAFDVVFAEGQRRFMETLTPYARQFLPSLPRPDVDKVTGVPPSIALEQRISRAGANSTVATVTEVAQYLRLLFAKVGEVHCPSCDAVVTSLSPDEIWSKLTEGREATRTLYAPAVSQRKGTYLDVFTAASRKGITKARVDGKIVSTDPPPKLAKTKEHSIDLVIFEGLLRSLDRAAFDSALAFGHGAVKISEGLASPDGRRDLVFSTTRACAVCGVGVPELDPRFFSFNTKQGQCPSCEGTGVLGGSDAIEAGVTARCASCGGGRLAALPRRVRMQGGTYPEFLEKDANAALAEVRTWKFKGRAEKIAIAPLRELERRLAFVVDVGLGYLSLGRAASTLSGGEMQRLRLSAQLGSGLTGALYVLDEPTIGLHPRDTAGLLRNLRGLVATGSTVVVVEHDAETIASADHVIDLGPSGGRRGGSIVSEGAAAKVLSDPKSPTARALLSRDLPARPVRLFPDRFIELRGARENNLKDVTFRIPAGRLTVVAGVSGSGKSTLVRRVFYPAMRKALGLVTEAPGGYTKLVGAKAVERVLAVDQSPIGRTPRSVPATFLGVWDEVRTLFASLPEAKVRGFSKARFSFNSNGGGRCTTCDGQGAIVAEMAFLPEVATPCEACAGARFEPSTLAVKYRDLSIGDVLRLSAEDACQVFAAHRKIARPLQMLHDLGVGYVQLGQGSNTLSGGEAQRLKLAAELTAGAAHEPTLYVLDEPTTGLHLSDVARLLGVLELLVARGDTLVVVEHHPDVIRSADWVVELGPEAGALGGEIVFEGEPAALMKAKTPTGRYFRAEKGGRRNTSTTRAPPRSGGAV